MKELQLQNNEIALFEALKKETVAIAEACDKLTVTDDVSLAVATQNLSKANSYIKDIEKMRKELKDPYFQTGKKIDQLADDLSSPLEKTLAFGKGKILAYNQLKEAIARKEQERIQSVRLKITNYSRSAMLDMTGAVTDEELVIAHNKWIKNFPVDSEWEEFVSDAVIMRTQLLDYAKARRIAINTPKEADEEVVEIIQEQITKQTEEVGMQQIEEARFTTTTAFRGTWKFEVADFDSVPKGWLQVDESAVKNYLKINKDSFTDGQILNGIKFYIDKTVTIR